MKPRLKTLATATLFAFTASPLAFGADYRSFKQLNFPAFAGNSGHGVAIGDIDDDGRKDIVFGRSIYLGQGTNKAGDTTQIAVRKNGAAGFTDISTSIFQTVPKFEVIHQAIIIADFNGDGKNDLFVGDSGEDADPFSGGQDRLFLKDPVSGKLVERTSTNLPKKLDISYKVSAGDFDGDGDLDMFLSGWGSGSEKINTYFLLNDGKGVFTVDDTRLPDSMQHKGNGQAGHRQHVVFDADFDGDLDIFTAEDGSSRDTNPRPMKLLRNDGTGKFPNVESPGDFPGKFRVMRGAASIDLHKTGVKNIVTGCSPSAPMEQISLIA